MTEGFESALRTYTMASDDFITVGAMLLFVLFTFVIHRSRTLLFYKLNTFFSSRQIYASDEISTNNEEFLDILLLILIGCLSVSIIIFAHLNPTTGLTTSPQYGQLMLVFGCVAGIVCLKGMLYSFVNWTFFNDERGRAWLSAFFFSVAIVSMLLFPLALIQIFIEASILNITYCLIGVVILQKVLLLCKLYVNFRPKRYGGLVFFVYFCSVELMPTLVAWHFLQKINI